MGGLGFEYDMWFLKIPLFYRRVSMTKSHNITNLVVHGGKEAAAATLESLSTSIAMTQQASHINPVADISDPRAANLAALISLARELTSKLPDQ